MNQSVMTHILSCVMQFVCPDKRKRTGDIFLGRKVFIMLLPMKKNMGKNLAGFRCIFMKNHMGKVFSQWFRVISMEMDCIF